MISRGATIGFIGLGKMGFPMVRRLLESGYLVRGFDNSDGARARFVALEGATAVETPAAAAADAAAVVLMLPTSKIVEKVLRDGGVLDSTSHGSIIIDMGSSEPTSTRALAGEAAERGVEFVDAPVSGGVAGAQNGTLTIMVGGEPSATAACDEILAILGSRRVHVGGVGAGHAVKALNNLLSATHLLATSEAVAIGREFGVDPQLLIDAVNISSGRSGSTERKFPDFILTETYDSGFTLDLMVKDMKIALGLGDALGVPAALGNRATQLWEEAAAALPRNADHTEIARWIDGT